MTQDNANAIARFIRAVALLALPSDLQLLWLRSLGLGEPGRCDELALEFDDGYQRIRVFVGAGLVPETALPELRALNDHLSAMSGPENQQLWTVEALMQSDAWEATRRLAGECLCALH